MICAACGERAAADPCQVCGESTLLDARYRLLDVLGKGAQATTWLAETLDGRRVAIKEMRVDADDKTRELVTREARVLKQIVVPDVPRYVDEFATSSGRQRLVCVVQEYVAGPTLEAYARDYRFTVDEAVAHVDALLAILAELHALSPPVIHRDVKPANVILRDGERVTLVDFGSVRDVWKGTLGGSTVTGTFGYMPPEQFAGDASPASDVYAVAVVLVALLSRKDPATMLGAAHTIAWRHHLSVDDALGRWLDRCLHADPGHRPADASIARAELVAARTRREAPPAAPGPSYEPPNAAHTRLPQALEAGPRVLTKERTAVVDPIPRLPATGGPMALLGLDQGLLLATVAVAVLLILMIAAAAFVAIVGAGFLVAVPTPSSPPPMATAAAVTVKDAALAIPASDCLLPGQLWRGAILSEPDATIFGPPGASTDCVRAHLDTHEVNVYDHKKHAIGLLRPLPENGILIARAPDSDGESLVLDVSVGSPTLAVTADGEGVWIEATGSFQAERVPEGTYEFHAGDLIGRVDLTGDACSVNVSDGVWTANCK